MEVLTDIDIHLDIGPNIQTLNKAFHTLLLYLTLIAEQDTANIGDIHPISTYTLLDLRSKSSSCNVFIG